jgi:hypothetical protein
VVTPRPAVTYVPGAGVIVPVELAAILRLELETALKKPTPGQTSTLAALQANVTKAAIDTRRERHQRLAEQAKGCPPAPFTLAPAGFTQPQSDWSMTAQEAAAQLGISQQRITHLARAGRLHGRQDRRGTWHLDPQSVEHYRKARRKQR